MELIIQQKDKYHIELKKGLPKKASIPILYEADSVYGIGKFGKCYFQNLPWEGGFISFGIYEIRTFTELIANMDQEIIELHCSYQNHSTSYLKGIGHPTMHEKEFGLTYCPEFNIKALMYENQYYENFDFHFNISYLQTLANEYPNLHFFLESIEKKIPHSMPGRPTLTKPMIQKIQSIQNYHGHSNDYPLFLDEQITQYLHMALDAFDIPFLPQLSLSARKKQDKAHEIAYILEKEIHEPITLDKIAKLVCGNRTSMQIIFKEIMGVTIHEYRKQLQLKMAARLILENKNKNLQQIALNVGYSEASTLIKAFKNQFGLSPGQYRKTYGAVEKNK